MKGWEATTLQDLDNFALLCYTVVNQQELTDKLARTAGTVRLLNSIRKTKLMNVHTRDRV